MLQLPIDFISTVKNTFGADGERFIADLPALIEEASQRWGLTNVQPVENLSYNFVAYARRGEVFSPHDTIYNETKGRGDPAPTNDVVLKIGIPRGELTSEMAALKLFNGEGACRLIDCDEEKGFLLLERLQPGRMLAELDDDEEATRIAAEGMKRIWRRFDYGATNTPLRSARNKFIFLSDWFDGLKRLRKMFDGRTGPLDAKLVARVEGSTKDLFAENHNPVLMHGDFHHYNILSSERGWLVIDPKGVIGPACYEVGPLMMNPWEMSLGRTSLKVRMKKRVNILHEHLGFERERILEWSLAHAILSAWWGIEDRTGWEYSMEFAELIASI
ncbi:MAG: phosphotransferase [Anaerolineales bacterium]|nr:phosphotransferase [Anaerolineales bacterium]